jgi:putative two-component system response regulator
MAEVVARTHHEKWNGQGYPHGLAGEDIPLVGRIVAVCDVFDALVSRRPYKEPWAHEDALAEIERSAGTHFDPDVAAAFVEITRAELGVAEPVVAA